MHDSSTLGEFYSLGSFGTDALLRIVLASYPQAAKMRGQRGERQLDTAISQMVNSWCLLRCLLGIGSIAVSGSLNRW